VQPHGPNHALALVVLLRQQRGDHHAVKNLHAQPFHFLVQRRLHVPTVDTQIHFGLVVVGEQEPAIIIAKRGAFEFIVNVANLDPHLLTVQQGIPAVFGVDIPQRPAIVAAAVPDGLGGEFFRRYLRARIGAGGEPVIHARAAVAAPFRRCFLEHNHPCAAAARV